MTRDEQELAILRRLAIKARAVDDLFRSAECPCDWCVTDEHFEIYGELQAALADHESHFQIGLPGIAS